MGLESKTILGEIFTREKHLTLHKVGINFNRLTAHFFDSLIPAEIKIKRSF